MTNTAQKKKGNAEEPWSRKIQIQGGDLSTLPSSKKFMHSKIRINYNIRTFLNLLTY